MAEWWNGGIAIPGATSASLSLSNVQATDAGDYSVVVQNSLGSVTSATATLIVIVPNVPPAISLTNPANNTIFNAPATIVLDAAASDSDGTVARVEFFSGSTKLGEDATGPYSFT